MSSAALADLSIWRGNNDPKRWRFKDSEGMIVDLTGYQFRLTIGLSRSAGPFLIEKKTTDNDPDFAIDIVAATLTWNIGLDESREIPLGRIAFYELEYTLSGIERTCVAGQVIGLGGANDDSTLIS